MSKKYYSLYNNIKLRKGGRKIAKLSEAQFGEKAKTFILNACKDDKYTVERINDTTSVNKIITSLPNAIRRSYYDDNPTILKDFKGIKPDWENFEITGGLRTVKGCPYIIMYVGGDWECPICIMVYYDGKQFRCYIPEKGNAYRKDTKRLFGNCAARYDSKSETYTDEWKEGGKTIISDDMYAFKQLVKDGVLDKEKDLNKLRELGRNIDYDINKCIEDFSNRVEPISIKESYYKYKKLNKLTTNNMNKTSKRALYESIIKSVSKTVKKHINESVNSGNILDIFDTSYSLDQCLGQLLAYEIIQKSLDTLEMNEPLYNELHYFICDSEFSNNIKHELKNLKNNRYYTLIKCLLDDQELIIYLNDAWADLLDFDPSDTFLDAFFRYLLTHSKSIQDKIHVYCREV